MTRQQIRKMLMLVSFLLFPITIYYFSPVLIIFATIKGIIAMSRIEEKHIIEKLRVVEHKKAAFNSEGGAALLQS